MQWTSELAVVWLPSGDQPYIEQFADRAAPGTSDYFYYALDGLFHVYQQWPDQEGKEPWAFCRDEQRLYSPQELRELEPEWQQQFDANSAEKRGSAEMGPAAEPRLPRLGGLGR